MAPATSPSARDRSGRGPAPPAITLPKGGGALRGIGEKFTANLVTGTGTLSVPIATSPSRSGFAPHLSLSYDSGTGNGPFGLGWTLSLPSISRKTDKGLPEYHDIEESDVFILSGAEDLVPLLNPSGSRFEEERGGVLIHRYRPRIEGLFARIERWTDMTSGTCHWRSVTPNNITTLYGKDERSRIHDPADATRIFSWLICESFDDQGNAIIYDYAAENSDNVDLLQANERNRARTANRYLKRVRYGNRLSRFAQPDLSQAEWLFETVLDYDEAHLDVLPLDPSLTEDDQHRLVRASPSPGASWASRPDPFSSYRSGFELRSYRRCRRILMFHDIADTSPHDKGYEGLVRSIDFDYADLDLQQLEAPGDELAHQGSTRFASFLQSVTQSGYVRQSQPEFTAPNGAVFGTYLRKSLPPLVFEYSKAAINDELLSLNREDLANLPEGLDGSTYQWIDLDGEGLSGILSEQGGGWFHKSNLGGGLFGPSMPVRPKPSLAALAESGQQFVDLAGDGQLDLTDFSETAAGFYERSGENDWSAFRSFRQLPELDWQGSNVRFVDLNGDGHVDVLVAEEQTLSWYPSLAEAGFGPARRLHQPQDEEEGPRLHLSDGTDSFHLADMCGDGLTDLVRIRNGEVCYWPNLGHGRFGAKVSLDNAPFFDRPDRFDHRRLRLADIDGSGTTDIIYLAADGARIYFNQSGNRLSAGRLLASFPGSDPTASVMTVDLFGNGTACLVHSSPLPKDQGRPLRYVDLMGGAKPHLLIKVANNLGVEMRIHYAPSTRFYLEDRARGTPWLMRLPFPVHVVEKVETSDRISGNLFVSRYAYHHGYFDGSEREFRGFGTVEQWDTEEFAALSGHAPDAANVEATSHVPPVYTKTWFHTGVYLGGAHVSDIFGSLLDPSNKGEYYREPGLDDNGARALLLDDTLLPAGLTVEEEREACRALKGSMLRQETYALDGSPKEPHPYAVIEQNFSVRAVQRRESNRHAIFFVHPRETLTFNYEREPSDPRVSHALTLEVDTFGNVLKSAAVDYGRRQPDPTLPIPDRERQGEVHVTYSESDVTNPIDEEDSYRIPQVCEERLYELAGLALPQASPFSLEALASAAMAATKLDYEEGPPPGSASKRLIERTCSYFRSDNLSVRLPLGKQESRGLPFESYALALTPGLVAGRFGSRVDDDMLRDGAHYIQLEGEPGWWMPAGRVFYSPDPAHAPADELQFAHDHFFLPHRFRDAFGIDGFAAYDAHTLLLKETRDALGNCTTVGERSLILPNGDALPAKAGHDYRALQPALVMDPNRNRAAVVFDALGMIAGTAVMGKPEDAEALGDLITPDFRADLTQREIDDFAAAPRGPMAAELLNMASSRIVYDLGTFARDPDAARKRPPFAATIVRETHLSDETAGDPSRLQVSLTYSDGFGQEIQKKVQAEPGPIPLRGSDGAIILGPDGLPQMSVAAISPRWIGSGWTVFNNKGDPVRQYEPFFSDLHEFEFDVRAGVSPIAFYDPAGRNVATLHPNHGWEKVVFSGWRQDSWDANDTVLIADPGADEDVGAYFRRIPETAFLPSWHDLRTQPGHAAALAELYPDTAARAAEADAARKSELHADTPAQTHADALGRPFLTIAHNRFERAGSLIEEKHATRIFVDIEGNQIDVVDALDRLVMHYDYDMVGQRIHQASMEGGERWMLGDAGGRPLFAWDSRGHRFRAVYDELGRSLETRLLEGSDPAEKTIGRTLYGETQVDPEASNLRGKPFKAFDQAGVATTRVYDYKGNLVAGERQLARDHSSLLDWTTNPLIDAKAFPVATAYDALNRVVASTAPDGSISRYSFNHAGLLETVEVRLNGAASVTPFVAAMEYDAKRRRLRIDYANGASTRSEFDRLTSRLSRVVTTRGGVHLQDVFYSYDPVGNITHVRDNAQQDVYFHNQVATPDADYTYDSLYRLITAAGREHVGAGGSRATDWKDSGRVGLAHPHDGQAMRRYVERYEYDAAGNFLEFVHATGGNGSWTRRYAYEEASPLEPLKFNNRLSSTRVGTDPAESYSYDAHGNTRRMTQLPGMEWDFGDRFRKADLKGGGTVHYVYDAGGGRVRKVVEKNGGSLIEERTYLGGFEIHRKRNPAGDVVLERETLHVMDGTQRLALVETRTVGQDAAPRQLVRYQFSNHLGSASLELDPAGRVLSYEEYYPYGATSFQSHATQTPKRYRYTGMERDEESGLSHHGARYYAPWLGRWVSCDPEPLDDGPNLYAYVLASPIGSIDPSGHGPEPETLGKKHEKAVEKHQNTVNNRRAQVDIGGSRSEPVKVTRQKKIKNKKSSSAVIPDEVREQPISDKRKRAGHKPSQSVVELKARHVKSESNLNLADRRADIKAGLEQTKNQLLELEKAGKIDKTTPGKLWRVAYDSDKGASSVKALATWKAEAASVRAEWVKEATDPTERAMRERVTVVTSTKKSLMEAHAETSRRLWQQRKQAIARTAKSLAIEGLETGGKMIPFAGIAVGLASCGDNLREGRYFEAAVDAVGLIPVVGDAVEVAVFVITAGDAVDTLAPVAAQYLEENLPMREIGIMVNRATGIEEMNNAMDRMHQWGSVAPGGKSVPFNQPSPY
ncbi:SpvB/TcaC N-terminal domain-containing protein [Sinorhizobium mexicanum]|uniref:Toxin n=1 Tax=Sinorhizobium mexicanum TaxID=375549 RepID=A0A859R2S2_9HYPH|nr:SpvB/TcaC N-terminal domain-containing protein [Sinorhizobium mexicanum]MBP1886474.1 RHS repeat-associated protein [Sinorhizobium mexicanum]QLL63948.1 toxin [Sinorhizobium mexicanum]